MSKIKENVIENKKDLKSILTGTKAKYIVGTILLSGLGVTLPRIFHLIVGSSAGATFLPMHIAVLMAALILGVTSGTIVAGISIICSFLLTGMPALTRLPYMLIELVIYAVILGLLNKKMGSYKALIITMILGRIIYSIFLFLAINVIGLNTYGLSVIESIKTGMPGLVIQLLFIPTISKFISERVNLKND